MIPCLYFVIKDVSVVFFLLSAMTIALYLIAYMFMYAAAIKLRYSGPKLARPFWSRRRFGMWVIAGVGSRACCSASSWHSFRPINCRSARPRCMWGS